MNHYPAFLDLKNRRCLIVGAGNVAYRKLKMLHKTGARIVIVAPEASSAVVNFAEKHDMDIKKRSFRASDLSGVWLVIAATGHASVNRSVHKAATDQRIFCNSVDDLEHCSYLTPAVVDRSPLLVAISSAGSAPVLARMVREKIESLLPQGMAGLANLAARWRGHVANRIADFGLRRRFWEAFFQGPGATRAMSGDWVTAETTLRLMLDEEVAAGAVTKHGEAWLVGAGPGDPDLLTLAALQALQTADVILYDRLVSDEILALARRDAEFISVGKSARKDAAKQEDINQLLIAHVESGARVCRLKGGDPFIFGRGGEEAEALRQRQLPFRVIPGITAAAGCAASAGIPLTQRGLSQSVAFVTAHGEASVDRLDWQSLARDQQTLVFYMGVRRFNVVMEKLLTHGRSIETPIAIIENGTTAKERVFRGALGQLPMLAAAHRVVAPSILIVGDVAKLGAETNTMAPAQQAVYDSDKKIMKKRAYT